MGISTGNEIRRVPGGQTYQPWGMLAAIDLHGCERRRLEDPGTLRRFVPSLINAIGMRAHGPLMLGWSPPRAGSSGSGADRATGRLRVCGSAHRSMRAIVSGAVSPGNWFSAS